MRALQRPSSRTHRPRTLFSSALLSAGIMFSCGKNDSRPPEPRPHPAISDSSAVPADASLKRKEGPRIARRKLKPGDYMLYPNVLGGGAEAWADVFRILDSGVEFRVEGGFAGDPPDRIILVRYGEKKEAATFLLEADLELGKGKKPGEAMLILTYPSDKRHREVFFRKISRTFKSGDYVLKDELLFSRRSRNSLKLLRANYWGVKLELDGREDKRSWFKYGKTKTYGENLLTVTVVARYGGKLGTATLDVTYPILHKR